MHPHRLNPHNLDHPENLSRSPSMPSTSGRLKPSMNSKFGSNQSRKNLTSSITTTKFSNHPASPVQNAKKATAKSPKASTPSTASTRTQNSTSASDLTIPTNQTSSVPIQPAPEATSSYTAPMSVSGASPWGMMPSKKSMPSPNSHPAKFASTSSHTEWNQKFTTKRSS